MTSTNSTSPAGVFSFSSGSSLIDFTALTTLIGSAAAESLILGNQGAAGVAWATMSAFGLVWVIRACISAASPGWLRETMGIRTPVSDLAVGMELSSSSFARAAAKTRRINGASGPLGFVIESSEALRRLDEKHGQRWPTRTQSWKEVYAFNLQMSQLLSEVPADTGVGSYGVTKYAADARGSNDHDHSSSHSTIRKINHSPLPFETEWNTLSVYTYAPYTFLRHHNPRFQVSVVALSLLKLGEAFTLRVYGAGLLTLSIIIPWAYFFVVAVLLEARELYLARRPEELDGYVDILAGRLPSMAQSGGVRRIIIGASRNPRTSVWWRVIWAVGAFVCTSSLIVTYMLMRQQTNDIVLIWAGFQVSWMIGRTCVYHFAEPTDVVARRKLDERPWNSLPTSMKARVVELMIACAQYQTSVHPRGLSVYNGDSFASSELASILIDTPLRRSYPLTDAGHCDDITVNVCAVVGDTVLASAAWISGLSGLGPRDLYDCCIISLSSESSCVLPAHPIAIPAVRFFRGDAAEAPGAAPDTEINPMPQFIPKGAPNIGSGTWWYYVPCENGLWLLIKRETPHTIIGKHKAEIVNDSQITATLSKGMNISLTHVNEIKRTVELSETARQALIMLL